MAEFRASCGDLISYNDSGTGVVLLFLHSFGHNKSMWFPQLAHFRELGFRVIAPDMPGHGDSSFDPTRHTIEGMARAYGELLEHLHVRQAVVIGISMGGYIALRMWATQSHLIRALVLSNTKAESDSPEIVERRHEQIKKIREHGLEWFIVHGAPRRLSPGTLTHKPWVLDIIKLLNRTVSAEANAATLLAMAKREDDTGILGGIQVPTLIISGSDDVFIPMGSSKILHQGIKGSQFHQIAHTGHVSSLEAPVQFNELVETFLRSACGLPMQIPVPVRKLS